jgi:hypothetical protein
VGGGDSRPGETPQAIEDQHQWDDVQPRPDYTQYIHLPKPPDLHNWVLIGTELHVSQDDDHQSLMGEHGHYNPNLPMAYGRMAIEYRWTVNFQIIHSNIGLHVVEAALRGWAKDNKLQPGAILDHDGEEMAAFAPKQKVAEVTGIGDLLPGIKDWRNKEWSDEDTNNWSDYYGEEDQDEAARMARSSAPIAAASSRMALS